MNIQPSVIVWTVICFLLLTVILKNLLFKPVLEVLDKRKEKVDSAEQKLRDIESISELNGVVPTEFQIAYLAILSILGFIAVSFTLC